MGYNDNLLRDSLVASGVPRRKVGAVLKRIQANLQGQSGSGGGGGGGGMSLGDFAGIPGGFGGPGAAPPTAAPNAGGCGTSISGPGEPWAILSSTTISSGAQTANSSLAEVFDASQSTQIDSDNKVPDDFRAESFKVFIGVIGLDDGGIEHAAMLNNLFVREADGSGGGQEVAIYPVSALGAVLHQSGGYGTSTGGAQYDPTPMPAAGIPWQRDYSTQGTYSLQYRLSTAFTTVNDVVITSVLTGRRFSRGF